MDPNEVYLPVPENTRTFIEGCHDWDILSNLRDRVTELEDLVEELKRSVSNEEQPRDE